MNVLICNDDGIFSEGLIALANLLKIKHNVTVYAPSGNRSGYSRSVSFHKNIEVMPVEFNGIEAYTVSGTPADCVKFALTASGKKFDLVVAGINQGPNLGSDIYYSGTVNACFEANVENIPAIAFSNVGFSDFKFDENIKTIDKIFDNLLNFVDNSHTLNVNIPNVKFNEVKGVIVCGAGVCKYSDGYVKTGENTFKLIGEPIPPNENDYGTDVYYSYKNYVTVTPVSHQVTDFELLEKLKGFVL
jgi:5'-nucleotidase